ncbi:MAG: NHLP leader peptide family RiPP precursor [Treponema sp.]|nr:NHLP leader peptide family RiPP precursor [Treponema sp.]
MENWTKEEMDAAYENIVKKAAKDPAFRKELLANPNGAITSVVGKEIPSSFKIRIIEEDPAYAATFILPHFDNKALDDSDLDAVAGGVYNPSASAEACGAKGCGANACAGNAEVSKKV